MNNTDAALHNYMEEVVSNILEDIIGGIEGVCKCPKCRMDIMALALNRLPGKYVVTSRGRVYARISELELQFKTDVVRELTKAMGRVKKYAQH